jgi:2-methylaconitate cis-trans-isomerase PrpF
VDYRGNCGNMSSAVGPFAVDEGLVRANGDAAVVRIFNTNTGKIIRATEVSMVDAASPCVFVRARDIGLTGDEMPDALDGDTFVLDRLQRMRRAAAVATGIAADRAEALWSKAVPAIGFA